MPADPLTLGELTATDLLLIIDVQNDFCPGGALPVPDGDEIIALVNHLSGRFDHAVCTQDWHTVGHQSFASSHPGRAPQDVIDAPYGEQVLWPDHCVQGTWGADFHPELDLTRIELILRKGFRHEIDSYSAFYENDHRTSTGLAAYLHERGFERLFFCGLATDFCVRWSAIDARREGFEAIVVEDACRAIDLDGSLHEAMRQMVEAGVKMVTAAR
jgi:nicotinamidase/pyrazinamidase